MKIQTKSCSLTESRARTWSLVSLVESDVLFPGDLYLLLRPEHPSYYQINIELSTNLLSELGHQKKHQPCYNEFFSAFAPFFKDSLTTMVPNNRCH